MDRLTQSWSVLGSSACALVRLQGRCSSVGVAELEGTVAVRGVVVQVVVASGSLPLIVGG